MNSFNKHTMSLCPACLDKIPAEIFCREDGAYMVKNCPSHGKLDILIEKDVDLYKRIMSRENRQKLDDAQAILVIPITSKCNIKCASCFYPESAFRKDLSLPEVKDIIKEFSGFSVAFSGGEPTIRDDLSVMINYAKLCGKKTCLMTNGLKLASKDYLENLKNAGLKWIVFSLNGLSDDILLATDGGKYLKTKLKALKNIKDSKPHISDTTLSFSIARGINESEFAKIFHFGLKNSSFISILRCRSYVSIGRANDHLKPLNVTEYVTLLAEATGHSQAELIDFWLRTAQCPSPYVFRMEYWAFLKDKLKIDKISREVWRIPLVFIQLCKYIGVVNLFRVIYRKTIGIRPLFQFSVILFAWPDRYTIDLEEADLSLSLLHLSDNKEVHGFWETIITRDKCHKD